MALRNALLEEMEEKQKAKALSMTLIVSKFNMCRRPKSGREKRKNKTLMKL